MAVLDGPTPAGPHRDARRRPRSILGETRVAGRSREAEERQRMATERSSDANGTIDLVVANARFATDDAPIALS